MMHVGPITLVGTHVRLEPLALDHLDGLVRIGLDPELWRWGLSALTTAADMRAYIETALDEQRRGVSLPFAVVDVAHDEVVGSTRYGNIAPADHRLEIGWTWYATTHQRTAANTETKLLLLTHAFETLGAMRVEFKTDALNLRSRAALARIGAAEEGTFRKHMLTASGRVRDSVYFSIVDTEWPAVKARLASKLRSTWGLDFGDRNDAYSPYPPTQATNRRRTASIMDRFAAARPSGVGRKTFWIVVAAIVAILACASVALSGGGSYPFWEYGVDGMPRPDGIIVQQDPTPPIAQGQPSRPPVSYTYKATSQPDGSIVITRNGAKWVTLANTSTQFLLSDPNGTGHPVVKFDHASSRGRAMLSKIRAQVR